jgi:hypothetical protein
MERNKTTRVSIPLDWIQKIETLENILFTNDNQHDKIVLPSDILLMIDEYL